LVKEVLFLIGGPQGSGLETSGIVLTRALAEEGYYVISDREYHSNIRGRHSYTHVRVSVKPRYSLAFPVDLVVAMDAESIFTHFSDIKKDGFFVVDISSLEQSIDKIVSMDRLVRQRIKRKMELLGIRDDKAESVISFLREQDTEIIQLDFKNYLKKLADKYTISPRAISRYLSGIAIATVAGLLGIDMDSIVNGLRARLAGREALVKHNVYLISMVVEDIASEYGTPLKLDAPDPKTSDFIVATGNEIVAMGKIVGGLRVQTYYPITPAADESLYLEEKNVLKMNGEFIGGIVVFQTEDEIAALSSAIGAALAGARSSTSTSGPGFSLMVEALSWAGMNEVPVVITYYQRGGPSTGMPTRGAQSDLMFAIYAGHGEFARVVISSGDHLETFYDAIDAFNIAEKYQVPVIHLLDKFLANSIATIPIPDFSNIRIERGSIVSGAPDYKRFDKRNLVSPRAFLGSNAVMWHTGNEHDEYGHVSEDPLNRIDMYEKRIKKMALIDEELPLKKRISLYGSKNPRIILIGWGYTKNPVIDALPKLEEKYDIGYLHFRILVPFPKDYIHEVLNRAEIIIGVEHSYNVQIANLVTMHTGIKISHEIVKFTGRPIYENEIITAVKEIVENKRIRVVLTHGE